MVYTVRKLAEVSKISVRTLHFYDEIGLLKPAYHGANGYRYYEEPQLLVLQQILFFRELGFELKEIKKILGKKEFDKEAALHSHKKILRKEISRIKRLIQTIDQTIEHYRGKRKMKEDELFQGFSKEKQAEYERQIVERFGDKGKTHIEESKRNAEKWSKADWERIQAEGKQVLGGLAQVMKQGLSTDSKEAREAVLKHFLWLKNFWTPDKKSYPAHGKFIVESELRKAYEIYDPKLPEFVSEAIRLFSESEL